jgi:hypothetical protein
MRARAHPGAFAALQHRRVAAAVQEQQALLAALDAVVQRRDELRRQAGRRAVLRRRAQALGGARQPPHVDQSQRRPGGVTDPLRHRHVQVAAAFRALPALQGRCRRAEQHERALAVAAPDREVTRRVARALLLLVRRVVLLVDDDEPEPRHRREDGEPGAEHEIGEAEVGRQPAAQPLRRRQAAVQGDDPPAGEAAASG